MNKIEKEYVITIPYARRSEYLDAFLEINDAVPLTGMVALYVSNMPYHLDAKLTVIPDGNEEEIEQIIKKHNLEQVYGKNHSHFMEEAFIGRKWDTTTFLPNQQELSKLQFLSMFHFAEERVLADHGYDFSMNESFDKIFVSYCHHDKEIVYMIEEELQRYNLNIWIDKNDIDIGDNILEKMLSGIDKSDIAIIFCSNYFLKSNYGKFELSNFWNKVITSKKKWFIIKLDDVDMSKIYAGLENYKYYDFSNNSNIDELVQQIIKQTLTK